MSPGVAAPIHSAHMKGPSTQGVKMKFFDTIGIDSRHSISKEKAKDPVALNSKWMHPRSQKVAAFQEKLKYDARADRYFAPKRRDAPAISKRTKKKLKSLTFDEEVEVLPIPMRTEYSNRVRARLWSSALEIQENAARNSVEFAAEGWNWKNVLEDDRMYVCVATSELIHPCHYEQNFQHGFR